MASPGQAMADWSIFASLLGGPQSFEDAFSAMVLEFDALRGLTYSGIGDAGVQLDAAALAAAATQRREEVHS